jgi:hypothetical protein
MVRARNRAILKHICAKNARKPMEYSLAVDDEDYNSLDDVLRDYGYEEDEEDYHEEEDYYDFPEDDGAGFFDPEEK